MKSLIIIILISLPSLTFCQITFFEVLSLEKKSFKEIQAFMLEEYTIIDDSQEYYYVPLKKCNPPKFAADSCQWICSVPNDLDALRSKYPLVEVEFKKSSNKNYEVKKTLKSTFAENYNSNIKKATTFINILEITRKMNNNCKNEFWESDNYINIEIQFNNPEHWKSFKSAVTQNATFQETWRASTEAPIELRYGIRRQIKYGYWNGVFINLYESGNTYHASISFNSGGVD